MKALITGASSGIGKDMAKYLSDLGYELILVSRDEKKLKEVQKELKTASQVIAMDLSISQNCIDLYNKVKHENIDFLINDAGFGLFGEFTQIDLEKEINLINTNITALHILTKLFLKDMVKRNSRTYIKCFISCVICTRTINEFLLCIKSVCNKVK